MKPRVIQLSKKELLNIVEWLDYTGLENIRIQDTLIRGVENTTSIQGYNYGVLEVKQENDLFKIATLAY